ncbi:Elongation factor 1-gamma, partial [Zootermopsis nevadensis]
TLYTYPENFRAYKVLIAAQYAGGNVKVAPGFVFGETNKTEAFLKKFPLGKVPAFETADGQYLTESNAIAYYVADARLRGQSDLEKAQVIQWLGFADSEILPASCAWVFPCLGIMQYNKQSTERAKEDVKSALQALNTHLLPRTYLVGETITLADIGVACTLLQLYQYVLDTSFRKPYQNVNRWFTTVVNQPQFKAVIGEFKFCKKTAEFDPKKFAEFQDPFHEKCSFITSGDGEGPKKPSDPDCITPLSEPFRKKLTVLAASKSGGELALAAEPKSKDPFDALPKGSFNMDDFKRCYSNEDETKSIPYFWEKFDPENYSIWFGEYKYNDELQKVFMSCNLITGMYQRLDKMRKNAFGSVCLFGTDNDSSISGIWIWRGQGLAFELSQDWQIDYESYKWTKLDPSREDTKKLVNQYLSWSGTDKEGRKFNQGKIFK